MNSSHGLLADSDIKLLISTAAITSDNAIDSTQIQPASLDLRLGRVAYRVRSSFLPGADHCVEKKLSQLKIHEIDLTQGAVLETNGVYIVPLLEELNLPQAIAAIANPKSSTGRLDVFTRVISDFTECFDKIVRGYKGCLYLEICPRTFPILVRTGSRLSQLRFRKIIEPSVSRILIDDLPLRVDLSSELMGYRAKRHTNAIDVDKVASYDINEFWEPLYNSSNELILEPDQFYILASYEYVEIGCSLAAEMIPFDPLIGEFRVHYAGFFDPGFGLGEMGKSRAVLEMRSHEVPFMLSHKQIIGKLLFEPMLTVPQKLYGLDSGSNYQGQKLKLAKQFF